MSDRYAKYTSFEIDYPLDRVLRITLNKPETYNSLDKDGKRTGTQTSAASATWRTCWRATA